MTSMLRMLALAGVVSAAACGVAEAQSFPGDNFAVINPSTGNTVRGSGVDTSSRTAVGVYQIDFNRAMSSCAYTASLNGQAGGQITVTPQASQPNRLMLRTFNSVGVAANRGFQVMVLCAPGASSN